MQQHTISRILGTLAVAVLVLGAGGCETPLDGTGVKESGVAPGGDLAPAMEKTVERFTAGGGHYLLAGTFDVAFAFNAGARSDGSAFGQFHQKLEADGLLIEFHGTVICMSVDPVNGRAWVGGVITENNSTDPDFQGAIHQVGQDIWFRVLDGGESGDRTTFLGFAGSAGIGTSREYCELMPWPANNARTHPVTAGNILVSPSVAP